MSRVDSTAVMPASPATRRAGLRPFETFVERGHHDVDTKDLLRAALDTKDQGERKLTCTLLRRNYHLLRWYNVRHGELIGERKEHTP